MKISFVEIAGFRGFKDRVRFDLPGGFVVLTGRNGVGKSTVLDALDFVLTGSINKFSVKAAKGGGLDEHIWWVGDGAADSYYVTVGFVDAHGKELSITRSREGGLVTPLNDVAGQLCEWEAQNDAWPQTLVQTSLIRDETIASLSLDLPEQARFSAVRAAIGGLAGPDYTERASALMRAATAVKADHDLRVSELQGELGRALSTLTEMRSVADGQSDVAAAERILATYAGDLITTSPGSRAEALRRRVAERKRQNAELEQLATRTEALEAERARSQSEEARSSAKAAAAALAAAQQAKALAGETLAHSESLMAAEREYDAFASHLVALVEHGQAVGLQDGHCPLCDAARNAEQFTGALQATQARLSIRSERAIRAAAQLQLAQAEAVRTEAAVVVAERSLAELTAQRELLAQRFEELKSAAQVLHLGVDQVAPVQLRSALFQRREETARLEEALFTLEASSTHDRITGLEGRVQQLRMQVDEQASKVSAAERGVETARQIEAAVKAVANQVLTEHFDTVMPLLKELYRRIRPHPDWREIEIDFGGRVRASLNFSVGDGRNPQFLFSSGQRRAAGIAFLLAIHLSRPWCRLRSLLLDDPVQHTDDYRALNLVEILSAVRRTGRQIVVAVEDPALADVLCRRLRSTTSEAGRRFDLVIGNNGAACIERITDVAMFPTGVLKTAEAS
jgi:chromosome segregation protein